MADLPTIQNNQSNGPRRFNAPTALSPNYFNPRISVQKIRQGLDDLTTVNLYQFPADLPKYFMEMRISDYSRSSLSTLGQLNQIGQVQIPLPMQLVDSHNVHFEQEPIGAFIGALAEAGNKVIKSAIGQTAGMIASGGNMKGISDATSSLTDTLKAAGALAAAAAANLGTELSGSAGTLLQTYLGYSPNQFMTILLKGPQYKRHEFTWKFSPRNPTESKRLNLMLKYIQNRMAVRTALEGAIWRYPAIFELAFQPNSQYMFKFKPAVLESLTANLSASGMPAFLRADGLTNGLGTPESIEVRMVFLELEFWLSEQFNDNNDPYNTK